jgi:hypothetical protein
LRFSAPISTSAITKLRTRPVASRTSLTPYHPQRTLLIKDLYEGLVAPKMLVERENWDNLSDDVCYLNPSATAQERADPLLRGRQKDFNDMNDIEKEAWRSPEYCSKVCKSQDVPDEEEYEMLQRVVPRADTDPAHANDTEKAGDTDPSDEYAREAWRNDMIQRKKNRTCFQYRWHDEQCCVSSSFKLGMPKARPDDNDSQFKWMSGWDLKGINDWIDAMGECSQVGWLDMASTPQQRNERLGWAV